MDSIEKLVVGARWGFAEEEGRKGEDGEKDGGRKGVGECG